MRQIEWDGRRDAVEQLAELGAAAAEPGFLVLRFAPPSQPSSALPWRALEPWTQSRAVTVAEVTTDLEVPAVEAALCCDLVYLRRGVRLTLPGPAEPPTAGLLWALGRAGRTALRFGLLEGGGLSSARAVELGLACAEVDDRVSLPDPASVTAATIARDLLRSGSRDHSGALELASFRLLFACGDPAEGAAAFLERRRPRFP